MSRKPLRRQRTGYGAFPVAGSAPAIISVCAEPLHTSDEWVRRGRPFWCIRWWGSAKDSHGHSIAEAFARTMTPTFCRLGVAGTPPPMSFGVSVGACGVWQDAEWVEHYTYTAADRSVAARRKQNPVSRIAWDRSLTIDTYQWYAIYGDIRCASPTPVHPGQTQWRPPTELLVLADDGGPHAEPTEPPPSLEGE